MAVGSFLFEIFVKLGLSSAALDKGLAQTTLKVKQTAREVRKETGQARDAVALLGRTFGVQLPAQVTKFAASVAPVRGLLASAFTGSILLGFGVAAGVAALKLVGFIHELATGAKAAREFESEVAKATRAMAEQTRVGVEGQLAINSARQAEISRTIDALAERNQGFGGLLRRGSGAALTDQVVANRLTAELRTLITEENRLGEILGRFKHEAAVAAKNKLAEATKAAGEAAKEARKNFSGLVEVLQDVQTERPTLLRGGALSGAEMRALLEASLNVPLSTALISPEEHGRKMADLARDVFLRIGSEGKQAANLIEANFTQAFQAIGQDLENSLVQFRGWGNVFLAILQEIQRALVRTFLISPFVKFLTGALTGALGGGGALAGRGLLTRTTGGISLSGRQHGGSALAGQPLLVGEKRPEIFVPQTSGTILPDARRALTGGVTVFQDNRGADLLAIARMQSLILGQGFREFARRQADLALRTV